ncbi:MAG: VWA domain-containing protein [Clostridia bacterium]|nr:VWA domain-containing protein [Clostridia bacterium]
MVFKRGMRDIISKYADTAKEIVVEMSIEGNSVYDFCCFGVDTSEKLSDERYMIFYNQTASPKGEIKYQAGNNSATFTINLSSLPDSINKLVFTASIDGNGVMGDISQHRFSLSQSGTEKIEINLKGSDFKQEKAIVCAAIYRKGDWRINAIASGFNGGLPVLLKSFGGEECTPSAPQPVSTPSINTKPQSVSTPSVNTMPQSSFIPPSNIAPQSTFIPQNNTTTQSAFLPQNNTTTQSAFLPQNNTTTQSAFLPQNNTAPQSSFIPVNNTAPQSSFIPGNNTAPKSVPTQPVRTSSEPAITKPIRLGQQSAPQTPVRPVPQSLSAQTVRAASQEVSTSPNSIAAQSVNIPQINTNTQPAFTNQVQSAQHGGAYIKNENELTQELMGKISLSKDKVNLEKHVVNLSKCVVDLSKRSGVNLGSTRAKVVVVLDYSGSMSMLYRNGTVQRTLNRLVPLGLTFDDNGSIDVYLFSNSFKKLDDLNLMNYENYVNTVVSSSSMSMGGTCYAPVLKAIIEGETKQKGFLFRKTEYIPPIVDGGDPTFILFITDGENSDCNNTDSVIRNSSGMNVFIQFIGIGNENFNYLQKLDDMPGRVRDNTGFSKMESLDNAPDQVLYINILDQFAKWLKGLQ